MSLVRLHERGFGIPVSRFMRALCEHYGAELHNFGPNSISQAAVFVAVCEGYLGIEAHWDLWIHLFRGELFIENVRGQPKRFARVGGLMLHLRPSRKNLYIPNKMTTNFHRQRVIPLTKRSLLIFGLTPGVPASDSRTSTMLLPRGIAIRRARNAVAEFPDDANNLWGIKMRPEPGYISVVSLNFNPLSICVVLFPILLPDSDLTAFCRGWAVSAAPKGLRSRRHARSTAFTQRQ